MAFNGNDAISVGMLQKLIDTDISDDWIEGLVEDEFGPNFDERDVSVVKLGIMTNLNGSAITLANLIEDADTRDFWVARVKENTERISEMRRARTAEIATQEKKLPAWHNDMVRYFEIQA